MTTRRQTYYDEREYKHNKIKPIYKEHYLDLLRDSFEVRHMQESDVPYLPDNNKEKLQIEHINDIFTKYRENLMNRGRGVPTFDMDIEPLERAAPPIVFEPPTPSRAPASSADLSFYEPSPIPPKPPSVEPFSSLPALEEQTIKPNTKVKSNKDKFVKKYVKEVEEVEEVKQLKKPNLKMIKPKFKNIKIKKEVEESDPVSPKDTLPESKKSSVEDVLKLTEEIKSMKPKKVNTIPDIEPQISTYIDKKADSNEKGQDRHGNYNDFYFENLNELKRKGLIDVSENFILTSDGYIHRIKSNIDLQQKIIKMINDSKKDTIPDVLLTNFESLVQTPEQTAAAEQVKIDIARGSKDKAPPSEAPTTYGDDEKYEYGITGDEYQNDLNRYNIDNKTNLTFEIVASGDRKNKLKKSINNKELMKKLALEYHSTKVIKPPNVEEENRKLGKI